MWILDKLKEQFIDSLEGFLELFYTSMNMELGELTDSIAMSPMSWEGGGPWNLAISLSKNVLVPIAGIILTYILCIELINMVMEKNNMREFDTMQLFLYVMKMAICVIVVNHAIEIVSGCIQAGAWVAEKAGAQINSSLQPGSSVAQQIADILRDDPDTGFGQVLTIWLAALIAWFISQVIVLLCTLAVFGRLMELLLYSCMAPIPLASMGNKEWSSGQNYIKALLAIAFQGFLMLFIFGLYITIAQNSNPSTASDIVSSLFKTCAFGVLLCVMLFRTGGISKSILGAH